MDDIAPIRYPSKNYTSHKESQLWWFFYFKYPKHDIFYRELRIDWLKKQQFRQRRSQFYYHNQNISTRISFQKSNEIGAFCRLTNAFAIVGNECDSKQFVK